MKAVGIAHKDIYTVRIQHFESDGKPFVRNEVRGVFGLGLVAGNPALSPITG
jgi:hypothetical protein